MRTIKNGIRAIFICLIALSCQHEETISVPEYEGTFNLRITVPAMQRVETRGAVTAGMIENLYVLVFDQNESFLSRSKATQMGANPGDYRVILPKTDPDLPSDKKKRTLHFIANCDWTGFSDVANVGKSANEIIMSLSTSNKKMAYWQNVVESEGIKDGSLSSPIELISNMARISILNETPEGSGNDMAFAMGDYLDHGTIAPFNQTSQQFDEQAVVESTKGTRQPAKESDFTNYAGIGGASGSIIECYEHLNSKSANPMYVIIKSIYPGDLTHTYYKVDIVGDGQTTLLDIQRNFHYVLHIREITERGYLTLEEAMANPASNNLIYSVLLEKYTSISYGNAALYIETISKTFVQSNHAFTVGFTYYPDINGPSDNSSVELSFANEDNANPAIVSAVLDKAAGLINCVTASTLPTYGYRKAQLVISSNQSGVTLRRVISIYLRKPSTFVNPYIFPSPIPSTANENVDLHFTMDPNLPVSYYPIEVHITVTSLSPCTETGRDSKLTLDHQIKDRYRYKYIVPNKEEQIVYFKTILDLPPTGTLILESDLFSPVTLSLGP